MVFDTQKFISELKRNEQKEDKPPIFSPSVYQVLHHVFHFDTTKDIDFDSFKLEDVEIARSHATWLSIDEDEVVRDFDNALVQWEAHVKVNKSLLHKVKLAYLCEDDFI